MATTTSSNLTSDLYDIATYVGEIQKENTDGVSEDTLMLGIYGYMREVFSNMIQNSIVMASEFANEGIATKAKFEKNVIAHALGLGITSLNAVPAQMEVFLTFIEDEIIDFVGGGSGEFKFDCDNKIYFGEYEFHPDYDIIIKRVLLNDGTYSYTAMYDINGDGVYQNPVSDITNPYLTPPVVMKINSTRYLFTSCIIRQVEKSTVYKKVLSDNTITSKTVNFEFDSQLAGFDVNVVNTNGTVHMTPVYEGLSSSGTKYPYLWYTYLDGSNIRLKFDRSSYYPRLSSEVQIRLQTTKGQSGNFAWSTDADYPVFLFDSDRLSYSNITVEVRPINNESMYGVDKKTIDELKQIIPKEALSRGSITNSTDLQNYFNAIDTTLSKMYFYKRRDNCLERLYYSFIVMKDEKSNIIPTNTCTLEIDPSDFETEEGSGKLILKRGKIFRLDDDGIARPTEPNDIDTDTTSFFYIIPYNFAINQTPMYGMYFLTTMNVNKNLGFTYINEECQYQYISTYINWNRKYTSDTDKYTLTMLLEQNLIDDDSMITIDASTGKVTKSYVEAFLVFYDDEKNPIRYLRGSIDTYNSESKIATFKFSLTSNDLIDENNNIYVSNVEQAGYAPGKGLSYGYLPDTTNAMIHIVTYQPDYSTKQTYNDIFGNSDLDFNAIVPLSFLKTDTVIEGENWVYPTNMPTGEQVVDKVFCKAKVTDSSTGTITSAWFQYLNSAWELASADPIYKDWCVANSYGVKTGVDMFYNYSEIVYSDIEMIPYTDDEGQPLSDGSYYFQIKNVPFIKYNYFATESMVEFFCSELIRRKSYIMNALQYIEDSFGMDFKFFNTYGPSKMYTLDGASEYLNRVNLSLKFRLGLQVNYDENIETYIKDDIKSFIDNLESIDSIHMTNLTTYIEDKYSGSIRFFEFLDMNGYGPGKQHIYTLSMPEDVITPELVNINTKDDQTPDITITIA